MTDDSTGRKALVAASGLPYPAALGLVATIVVAGLTAGTFGLGAGLLNQGEDLIRIGASRTVSDRG